MSERMRYWRRRVAEFESSGLNRAAFCRRRRLNYHTMTYWIKRLANSDGAGADSEPTSFVEVSLPAVAASAGYGRSIRLGAAFDGEAVARLIRTLESC